MSYNVKSGTYKSSNKDIADLRKKYGWDKVNVTDEDFLSMYTEIDNSKESAIHSTHWKVDKKKLFDELAKTANGPELIKEAFIISPSNPLQGYPRTTKVDQCKYPHHKIKGNIYDKDSKLVLDIKGVQAAFQRLKQMGEYKGENKKHINRHYQDLDLISDAIKESPENFTIYHKCEECGFDGDLNFFLGIRDNERDFIKKKHPNWNLDGGKIGHVTCPECKTRNHISLVNESLDFDLQLIEITDFSFMEDYLVEASQDTINENKDIYPLTQNDVINPYFVKWLFTQDEFSNDQPETFNFDILIHNYIKENYVYGYFIENRLEGFIRVRYNSEKNSYPISMFFVNPKNNGKGIGQKLMHYAISKFGDHTMSLKVFAFNVRAIHIYEKYGFKKVGAIIYKDSPESDPKRIGEKMYLMKRDPVNNIKDLGEMVADSTLGMLPPSFPLNTRKEEEETIKNFLNGTQKNEINKKRKKLRLGYIPVNDDDLISEAIEVEEDQNKDSQLSEPEKTDKKEKDANGKVRKELYIAFIEYAKGINNKNTFGSVFDKDAFELYSYVPHDLRYFYRLANPLLCVLDDKLTFFALSELKNINKDKDSLEKKYIIFAADDKGNVRIYQLNDKKVYSGKLESNNIVTIGKEEAPTFDEYIQKLVGINILGTGLIKNDDVEEVIDNNESESDESAPITTDDEPPEIQPVEDEKSETETSEEPKTNGVTSGVLSNIKSTITGSTIKSTIPNKPEENQNESVNNKNLFDSFMNSFFE